MRKMVTAIAFIFALTLGVAHASDAQYGDYTYEEFKCVAKAVWYEGGSSGQNKEEQKLGAHTMLMRKKKVLADPYLQKDWGGPDMCSVIKHPRQYSYHAFSYSRVPPIKTDLWAPRKQCELPLTGKITSCQLWEITKDAVREVMAGLKDGTYTPPAGLEESESYIMRGCADREGPESEKCLERFRVGDASRCYFQIALVPLSHEGFPAEDRIHSYYRKKTVDEAILTINAVPAVCKTARRTVDIMYESHVYWAGHHGRLREIVTRPPAAPDFFVDPPKSKKKAKAKKKGRKIVKKRDVRSKAR